MADTLGHITISVEVKHTMKTGNKEQSRVIFNDVM